MRAWGRCQNAGVPWIGRICAARPCRWWLLCLLLCCASTSARAQDRDPWFGRDKLLHFSLSAGIAGGAYALSVPLLEQPWQRALLAAAVDLSLGAAKELYDATGHGDPSLRDFTWDVLGCAVGVGVALLLDYAFRSPAQGPPDRALLRF